MMECPTPTITLPSTHNHLEDGTTGSHIGSGACNGRCRRKIFKEWINDNALDWHMGLVLDGVKTYLNLSKSLPEKSQLLIYSSPIIDDFDPEVKVFKIHEGHKNIVLKVVIY